VIVRYVTTSLRNIVVKSQMTASTML